MIGQFNNGFILSLYDNQLVLIDQHAASEIANFTNLMKNAKLGCQSVIVPIKLELNIEDEYLLNSNIDRISKTGFKIKNNEILAVPLLEKYVFTKEDLILIIRDEDYFDKKMREVMASKACRMSVMIGERLCKKRMESIVRELYNLETPWWCPHGRPVMKILT